MRTSCMRGHERVAGNAVVRKGRWRCLICERTAAAAKWARSHPIRTEPNSFSVQTILRRVEFEPNTGCWLWSGAQGGREGYGAVRIRGRVYRTHRAMYELHHGSIPAGMVVCHRCDTPACCNPDHLFIGTDADNAADRDAKGRGVPSPGSLNPSARLTEAQVVEIRALGGALSQEKIGQRYGVTQVCVSSILRGKTWRCLA